jgi:hypothetical protein
MAFLHAAGIEPSFPEPEIFWKQKRKFAFWGSEFFSGQISDTFFWRNSASAQAGSLNADQETLENLLI